MNQRFLLSLALSSLVVSACSNSSSDDSKKGPVATVASGNASANGSRAEGGPVSCENPITVDDNGGDLSGLTGKFRLESVQIYTVVSPSNDSFLASASSADGFRAKVDCQGVRDVAGDNYAKNWTDDDGTTHSESRSRSSHMDGHLAVGEEVELGGSTVSPTQRELKISFKNGRLESATSKVIPTDAKADGDIQKLPKGPIDMGNGNTLTINSAATGADSFEIRLKIESKSADGTRVTEMGRAVYVRK